MLLAYGNTELVPSFSAVRQLFEISRFSGRSGHTLYGPCRDRYDHREDAASRKVLDEWVASEVFGEVIGGPVSRYRSDQPPRRDRLSVGGASSNRRESL